MAYWWVVSTQLKNLVKLDHFPNFRGENKKRLKPPPSKDSMIYLPTWFPGFFATPKQYQYQLNGSLRKKTSWYDLKYVSQSFKFLGNRALEQYFRKLDSSMAEPRGFGGVLAWRTDAFSFAKSKEGTTQTWKNWGRNTQLGCFEQKLFGLNKLLDLYK